MSVHSLELQSYDAIGISAVYENLLRWFNIEVYAQLATTVIDPFILWMTRLTCKYIIAAKASDKVKYTNMLFVTKTLFETAFLRVV